MRQGDQYTQGRGKRSAYLENSHCFGRIIRAQGTHLKYKNEAGKWGCIYIKKSMHDSSILHPTSKDYNYIDSDFDMGRLGVRYTWFMSKQVCI